MTDEGSLLAHDAKATSRAGAVVKVELRVMVKKRTSMNFIVHCKELTVSILPRLWTRHDVSSTDPYSQNRQFTFRT